ncbi:MAG: GNAT family N-acetyltransferase [Pseudomonadota bacterium]
MNEVSIYQIAYGSEEYELSKSFRQRILREPLGIKLSEDDLRGEDRQHHFIAMFQNSIVGTVVVANVDNERAKLRQMAVDDNHQKNGIGKKLISQVDRFVHDKSYKFVVCTARKTSAGFYKKMGFIIDGEPFEAMGMTIYNMVKSYE